MIRGTRLANIRSNGISIKSSKAIVHFAAFSQALILASSQCDGQMPWQHAKICQIHPNPTELHCDLPHPCPSWKRGQAQNAKDSRWIFRRHLLHHCSLACWAPHCWKPCIAQMTLHWTIRTWQLQQNAKHQVVLVCSGGFVKVVAYFPDLSCLFFWQLPLCQVGLGMYRSWLQAPSHMRWLEHWNLSIQTLQAALALAGPLP